MSKRLLSTLLLSSVVGVSACGGSGGSSSDTVPADAGLVVMAKDGIAWDATSYTATAGAVKVVLKNDSSLVHDLVFVKSDGVQLPSDIKVQAKGEVKAETVTLAAGTYTVICTIAGHSNMKATLTVS